MVLHFKEGFPENSHVDFLFIILKTNVEIENKFQSIIHTKTLIFCNVFCTQIKI